MEIANYDKAYQLHQFPIPDGPEGDAIIQKRKQVKDDVMSVLAQGLEFRTAQWNTVCVFMCGQTAETLSPTIVISADSDTPAD